MTRFSVQGIDGMERVLDAVLGGSTAATTAQAVVADARRRREDEFAHVVADCGLATLARHMPLSSASRIARAPLFAGLIRMRDDTAVTASQPNGSARPLLANWINAELALLGEKPVGDQPLWTALGDAAFEDDQPPYHAPTLWGVVVDTRSPYVVDAPFLPPHMRERVRLETNASAALAALREAMQLLAEVNQPSADLTVLSLASLVLYDTTNSSASFSSSSSRSFPGAAALSNVTGSDMDLYRLADSVLHEAIHAFLYAVEGSVPFFRPGSRHEPTIRSPWTGTVLPLHAFVHACFVWLALLAFWRRAMSGNGPHATRAVEWAMRARKGFVSNELGEAIAAIRPRITPEAEAVLLRIQALGREMQP
jgi:HEXXH motif-containing protein